MSYVFNHPEDECSEMFLESIDKGGGGPWAECQCGIDHYAAEPIDPYDCDGEPIVNPPESTKVKHHEGSFVTYREVNGLLFVNECKGCRQKLKRYETFIWEERQLMRNYLKTRINQEKEWADHEDMLNKLAQFSERH